MRVHRKRKPAGLIHRAATLALAVLAFVLTLVSAGRAETILSADLGLTEAQGWTVYWNSVEASCFAEQVQSNRTWVLLGVGLEQYGHVIRFYSHQLDSTELGSWYETKLRFDGRPRIDARMKLSDVGGVPFLGWAFRDAKLHNELLKAKLLKIEHGETTLATISLKGSRAAFNMIDACLEAMEGELDNPTLTDFTDTASLAETDGLMNEAQTFREDGRYAEAEPLLRRALDIREKGLLGPEHIGVAIALNSLAVLLRDNGDVAGAEPLLRRALAINEKTLGTDHPEVAATLNNLALVLQDKDDLAGAEPLLRRALAIDEKRLGTDHRAVLPELNNLALLLHAKGELAEAERLLRRAVGILGEVLIPGSRDDTSIINNLADLLSDKGDLTESLDLARRTAEAGNPRRDIYLHALFSMADSRPAIVAESFEVVQQTVASEAGAALRSLGERTAAGEGELPELVRREQDLEGEHAEIKSDILAEVAKEPTQRSKDNEKAIRKRDVELREKLAMLGEELAKAFPGYAELRLPSDLSLADAQQLLGDDEALIVIDIAGIGQGDDYVWAVTHDAAVWKEIETRQGDIAECIARLRTGLDLRDKSGRVPVDPALAHELYRKLLDPVEAAFAGKSHLIFVLNGAVSSLPPQVLVTKPPTDKDFRTAHWLVRDHAITVLPNVSSLKLLRSQASALKARKRFIGYGDPVFNAKAEGEFRVAARGYNAYFRGALTDIEALKAGLPRLPGTARELLAVASSLGAPTSDVILRDKASEAAVKQTKLSDYNIVYFATHGLVAGEVGLFDKSAAEPALAFTIPGKASELDDGLLTASEIAQLKLNADWVVMSACNTAAEGKPGAGALSGLARAFFYAGARSLLVSHWVVDDDATAELMSRTFANVAANPKGRQAAALQKAILSVMNDPKHPEWADPAFWAPFVLVGEAR